MMSWLATKALEYQQKAPRKTGALDVLSSDFQSS